MINANELRIGNYINVYDGVGPKYMYQVTGYDIDEIDGDGTKDNDADFQGPEG